MSIFSRVTTLIGLYVLCFAVTASAATYTVTKIADTNDGTCDADCSLREAIVAANGTADNDAIQFSSLFSSAQTITLSLGDLIVTNNGTLSITGAGPNLTTLSGNNASRILTNSVSSVLNLSNLRFTAGNGVSSVNTGRAGAVYNAGGTLVITNSILTGNSAANGGAMNNASSGSPAVPGNVTVIGCSITANTSTSSGSAMQNFSTSTFHIRDTTVSGNTSSGTGVAGAFQANGTVTITNSTFSGNSAPGGTGGGVYFNGSSMVMTNVTIANNTSSVGGGGIHRTGTNPTLIMRNTIVAGNNGAAGSPDVFGLVSSQGNNIIGNTTGSTGWVAADLQNTAPLLDALTSNGGLGATHLPQTASPAINAGQNCVIDLSCATGNPPAAVTADQRGVSRPQGSLVDIGSVEVQAAAAFAIVSGTVVTSGGTPIPRAIVTLSNMGGIVARARTNGFGRFTLFDVPTGQTYSLTATGKTFSFTPQIVTVGGDVTGVVITAGSGAFTTID